VSTNDQLLQVPNEFDQLILKFRASLESEFVDESMEEDELMSEERTGTVETL
jgi:hypothetical protein